MPLKLRRTLSMEDLQNASDDEMDVLLSASEDSPRKCMKEAARTSSGSQQQNGGSQRERFFPFSLISDDSTLASSSSSSAPPTQTHRPRPRSHVPVLLPVPVPDTDDFFLHGPQTPILKGSYSAVGNLVDSGRINGISSSPNGIQHHQNHNSSNGTPPISKDVRFEELDEDEYNQGEFREKDLEDQRSSIHAQVNQVTQKMKDNIGRLLEREASLDSFADLTDQLHYSGDIYRHSTEHLRRKLWWRQQKTRFVLTALIIFSLLLLLVPLISRLFRGNWG